MASQVEDIKWLPNAAANDKRFLVDGFNFKTRTCKHYILTHFHSDHTCGLNKGLAEYGTVYTSEVTARLLVHDMGFPAAAVVALPLHTPFMLEGCRVRLLDANHCPGAVMLLVEVLQDREGRVLPKPQVILHTGDCRWEDRLAQHIPAGLHVDTLFLDTTYCVPRYTFPAQMEVIEALAEEVRQLLQVQPHSLLVVAAYHIGKEKVFLNLAQKLGIKVWCSDRKRRVLQQLGLPDAHMALLTTEAAEAQLHVSGWGGMRPDQIQQRYLGLVEATTSTAPAAAQQEEGEGEEAEQDDAPRGAPVVTVKQEEESGTRQLTGVEYAAEDQEEVQAAALVKGQGQWTHIIAIRATGWSFRKKARNLISRWVSGHVTLLSAPYSEHSSFAELCSCVKLLRPSRIIPTANAPNAAAAKAIVERFVPHMDLSRQRGRMDMYLQKCSSAPATLCPPTPAQGALQPAPVAQHGRVGSANLAMQAEGNTQAGVVTIDLTADDGEHQPAPAEAPMQAMPAVAVADTSSRQAAIAPGTELDGQHAFVAADDRQGSGRQGLCGSGEQQHGASGVQASAPMEWDPGVQVVPAAGAAAAPRPACDEQQQQQCQQQPPQSLQLAPQPLLPQQVDSVAYAPKDESQQGLSAPSQELQPVPQQQQQQQQEDAFEAPADAGTDEVPGVDAAEQQRIWDMIQTQKAPPPSIAQKGGMRGQGQAGSGAGRSRSQTSRAGSASGKASAAAPSQIGSTHGAASAPRGKGRRPQGAADSNSTPSKRARGSVGPAGTKSDPVVLDMTTAEAAGTPGKPGASASVAGSAAGLSGKQSSIRSYFSPATARSK